MGMSGSPWHSTIAASLIGLALAGCGGTSREGVATSPEPSIYGQAARSPTRYRYTEADVRFMSDMIHHHAQALEMSAMAPTHGASPSVRILAERIINGQQDEIATMQRWLRDRGLPVPEIGPTGTGTMTHGPGHEHLMPGMLTQAQLRQLDNARGAEFDRLFLTFMIQHHRGAVTMVKELFGTQGAAQEEAVFKFASDANVDQSTEIARMERMLAALPASERP
jgi:uncharacterized protein (DUF305 family)